MISVIITTRNRKTLLKRAIDSVLSQTWRDLECIVVDDASTDGTQNSVKTFDDKRIRYFYIPVTKSKGGNYARNFGITMARGEYIAFLDDDDRWSEDKLKYQKKLLDNQPEVGMVYCQMIKEYVQEGVRRKIVPDMSCRGDCSKKVFIHIPCTTSTMMVRKNVLAEVGGFDENISFWQEYDLCIRICQKYKIDFIKKYLVIFRCDSGDSQRLTNKFYEWIEAVKYQNHKYAEEIKALPAGMKLARKKMIYEDAALRCRNSGNRRGQRYYLGKIYQVSQSKEDFWNWMFNDATLL